MEQQRHGGLRFSPTLSLFLFFSFLSFLFLSPPPSPGERASQQRTKHKPNPSRLATRAIHRRPRQEFCFHSASMHTHTHTRCVSIENCRSGHPSFFQLVSHLSPPPLPSPPLLASPGPLHTLLQAGDEHTTDIHTWTQYRRRGQPKPQAFYYCSYFARPARLFATHTHTHTHISLSLSLFIHSPPA